MKMHSIEIKAGDRCSIFARMKFYGHMQPFLDKECIVIKHTKNGLIQIALVEDLKNTISVPRSSIKIKENGNDDGPTSSSGLASCKS